MISLWVALTAQSWPSQPSVSAAALACLGVVDAFVRLEAFSQVINNHLVEVVTTEVGVARGGQHLKNPSSLHRDVEGAAAEVEHQDALVALLVEAVAEPPVGSLMMRSTGAGDLAGVLVG